MKIIFDGSIFGDGGVRTGVFVVAWNILKELAQQEGIKLIVYTDVGKMPNTRVVLNNEFADYKCKILFENLAFIRFLSKLCRLLPQENLFWIKALKRIITFISYLYIFFSPRARKQLKDYDIFFSPDKMYPFVIKKEKGMKKFIFLHDTILYKFPEYYPQVHWYNYRTRNLINNMNGEDYYFANSLCTKNDFLKLAKKVSDKQITVVPLACDEKFRHHDEQQTKVLKKYHIPTDKKYIFSLCSIEPRKNLIRAVETFLEFVEKNRIKDMLYVLGGAEWNSFAEQFMQARNSNEKWEKYVIQIGYVEDMDLPYLYSKAQWFVYTSQYEGFGLPPLEAMSCGCPVIVSNNSSLPEVVGDAGILIPWDSDVEHIRAYEKYYYEDEFRHEMSIKALKQAEKFSWKNAGKIIINRMKEVIGEEASGCNC